MNIFNTNPDTTTLSVIIISKYTLTILFYPDTKDLCSYKTSHIRHYMSEEEFFQESTINDFSNLYYDEYVIIQQILSTLTEVL